MGESCCTVINVHSQPGICGEATEETTRHPRRLADVSRRCSLSARDEAQHENSNVQATRAAALHVAFAQTVEISQPNFTSKDESREGVIRTQPRIDRILVRALQKSRIPIHDIDNDKEWSLESGSHRIPIWAKVKRSNNLDLTRQETF